MKPTIGILPDFQKDHEKLSLSPAYARAVYDAGGSPIILPHLTGSQLDDYIKELEPSLHGLLLPGSPFDVNPRRYHQSHSDGLGPVSDLRDDHDLTWLNWAWQRRVPILGICYGCQILNVFRGGTLIQDITSRHPDALDHKPSGRSRELVHTVRFTSTIRKLSGLEGKVFSVNSSHHQAIDNLSPDFTAIGWSSDGILEAYEVNDDDRWVVGVQWHPELIYTIDPASALVFKAFVRAAYSYASVRKPVMSARS